MNVVSVSKTKTSIRRQKIESPVVNGVVTTLAHLVALIQLIPAVLVIVLSFCKYDDLMAGNLSLASFTLDNYKQVLGSSPGFKPILTSTVYALLAALIVVGIILICSRWITKYNNKLTKMLEAVLMIPWFLPATLIALGLLNTFNVKQPLLFNQVLIGTTVILLVGYVIIQLPSKLRIIKAAYLSLDNSLEDAAKNLGASGFSTYFKVILPILMPTVMSAILLTFNGLFAEFDMTVYLFHPKYQTLGIVINNATGSESAGRGSVMLSFVYAVVIMMVSAIATYLVYGRREKRN